MPPSASISKMEGKIENLCYWGADFNAKNGQAIVTNLVVSSFISQEHVCKYQGRGFISLNSWLSALLRLFSLLFIKKNKCNKCYFVPSRSFVGVLRDMPALFFVYLSGARLCIHVHGSDIVNVFRWPVVGRIYKELIKGSTVIVPSSHLLIPLSGLHFIVSHVDNFYPVNTDVTEKNCGSKWTSKKVRVAWNSNLMVSKGFFTVLDAVTRCSERGLDIRLEIVGAPIGDNEGSRARVIRVLQSSNSKPFVNYNGVVDRPATLDLLVRSNLICFPSRYSSECQPLALIDAMCCGLSIIAYDTPALRATLMDYPARFIGSLNPDDWADEIIKFAESNYIVTTADKNRAMERFSQVRFFNDMSSTLRSI